MKKGFLATTSKGSKNRQSPQAVEGYCPPSTVSVPPTDGKSSGLTDRNAKAGKLSKCCCNGEC